MANKSANLTRRTLRQSRELYKTRHSLAFSALAYLFILPSVLFTAAFEESLIIKILATVVFLLIMFSIASDFAKIRALEDDMSRRPKQ